jgi:hypothetical protein
VCCFERFNKQSQVENHRRLAFEEASAVLGAQLTSLRKAMQFEDWSRRPGTMPYILLTDWREAKPCMEILARRNLQTQPVFTVVICSARGQYGRASRWAESRSEDSTTPVYICQHLECPHSLVYGLLAQMKHHLNKNSMPTLLSLSLDKNAWPQLESCDSSNQGDVHSMRQEEENSSEDAMGLGVHKPIKPAWQSQEVGQVMQTCWEKCESPVHMEQLLRDAMPVAYDD